MSKMLNLTAAIVGVFLFAFTAAAIESPKTEALYFGKIVSIDAAANKFVMSADAGKKTKKVTIAVTAQTRIGKGGAPITLTNLAVDDKISVKLNDDKKTAATILVITGKP